MRLAITFCLAALAATGAAVAGSADGPVWVKAPDRDAWAQAYPAEAARAGVEGQAHLKCAVGQTGLLDRCAVLDEAPANQGFGAAALSLAAGMQVGDRLQNGQASAGRDIVVPVRFTQGLLHPGAVISNPDWLRMPDMGKFGESWPAAAHGGSGKAVVGCVVTGRGLLDKCSVVSEQPAGEGFGHAALLLTASFLMRPMTIDGQPVGGAGINIPIKFAGPYPGANAHSDTTLTMRVADHLPWSAVPTAAEMSAAFPKQAIGRFASGHVVLRCHMAGKGILRDCETITADPDRGGFDDAAQRLAKEFQVAGDPAVISKVKDLYVDLPFDFHDPAQPAPPMEIVDPLWLVHPNADWIASLLPPEALKSSVATARVVVVCDVVHTGALTGCTVESEQPAGLGLGRVGLAVAAVMVMNPWTNQGLPVDGGRIRLPIRLDLAAATAPAAPAPAAKP